MAVRVALVVPVKELYRAKTRLRSAAPHAADRGALALAMARDTVAAAAAARSVARVLVVSSDPEVTAALRADGVEVVPDAPGNGLNPALRYATGLLRASDPTLRVGALHADLPALRTAEIEAALHGAGRSFCPDRAGSGTTLLLAGPGADLDPRFGPASARAHHASGAGVVPGEWPGLRCDVDTPDDLAEAVRLGLGPATHRALELTAGAGR